MGYYDDDGFYFHEESDTADPGAGFSELLNKPTAALPAAIRARVAADLADDPTIRDAAEDAVGVVVDSLDLVQFGDPGIPEENQWPHDPQYILRETDKVGRISRAVRVTTGAQYMPLATIDNLSIGDEAEITWRPTGSGVAFALTDANNKMSDLAIGEDGHLLPHTIAHIAAELGVGVDTAFDIVVCAGQSNSAKASYLELPNFREEDSRLFAWEGGQIVPLAASEVYLGAEFVRAYAKHAARTGRPVLVIPAGVGSLGFTTTSIQPAPEGYRYFANGTWDRTLTADTKNRYAIMVSLTLAALAAAGAGSRVAALLWSQGEADGGLTQSEYEAKLDDLISAFRVAVDDPELPVVVGSMTPEMHTDHEGFEHIAVALADTPRRVERVGFVWGPQNGHRYSQTVHYSYAGQIERAGRMAQEGLLEALANVATNEPVAPLNLRVDRDGATATAYWDRPRCHVETLTVEFSTDAGTSWTAATIDTQHGSRATASVPASTPVTFRITVTNSVGTTMPAITNA